MLWHLWVLFFNFEYLFEEMIIDFVFFYWFLYSILLFEDSFGLIIVKDRSDEFFCQNFAIFFILSIVPNPIPIDKELYDKLFERSIWLWLFGCRFLLRALLRFQLREMLEIILRYFCLSNSIVDFLQVHIAAGKVHWTENDTHFASIYNFGEHFSKHFNYNKYVKIVRQ